MKKSVHAPGTLVGGRYRLIEMVGQGGMAEVWRAEADGAEGFRRKLAVKRILPHLGARADHRAMFAQEAQLTATLDHPNVVQIYDFGEDTNGLYIAMEWVEGLSLHNLNVLFSHRRVLPSPALASAIMIEVLRGLEAAHDNFEIANDGSTRRVPIIHRDVSPSNILLSVRGVIKLADFGLARALHRTAVGALTPVGVVKGKLAYMAPEVMRGKPASPQSDLYSCGVVLWEFICGQRLFSNDKDVLGTLLKGASAPPLKGVRDDVPTGIAEIVDRALATDPSRRFESASSFARALSDALRMVPERTDTSRLTREVVSATIAWRELQRKEIASADALSAVLEPSESIYFDVSTSAPLPSIEPAEPDSATSTDHDQGSATIRLPPLETILKKP